jgi:hypothetical protein
MNLIYLDNFDLVANQHTLEQALAQGKIESVQIGDHLGGFDLQLRNDTLDQLQAFADQQQQKITLYFSYLANDKIKSNYPGINFKSFVFGGHWYEHFKNYHEHPILDFNNFVCSFNGSSHVSRRLLVSVLEKFGWFDSRYSSKNFAFTADMLDGHIKLLVGESDNFYRKFFLDQTNKDFYETVYMLGQDPYLHKSNDHANNVYKLAHDPGNHIQNIYRLENAITQSFLHVVSETMATNYYPLVTEKFLYSVVTRGLFLCYGPPGWHNQIEQCFGFRLYKNLFDYDFDLVQNPVERLLKLMSLISKFRVLSKNDWHDLYAIEQENIEYNHDHYHSGNYIKYLEKFL